MKLSDLFVGDLWGEFEVNAVKAMASRIDELEDKLERLLDENDRITGLLFRIGKHMSLKDNDHYKCIHVSTIFDDEDLYDELVNLLELKKEE